MWDFAHTNTYQLLQVEHSTHKPHQMEATKFSYSTKNVPVPPEDEYIRELIAKVEHFCRRLRWKVFFYLNPEAKVTTKECFGFKSRKSPPQIPELTAFENQLLRLIKNTKLRRTQCNFQSKLQKDIQQDINGHNKILVPADKSNNFYKLDVTDYKKLLQNNITTTYRKVSNEKLQETTVEAKSIAQTLQLADRINIMAKREAFLTLKDHKPNFINHPTCRLINPAKSEIGKVSKHILERINNNIRKKTTIIQWTNTSSVLEWFRNIEQKEHCTFIEFDVIEFYPSISANLLNRALDFAANYDNITTDERTIILHTKKSVLFSGNDI